MFISSIPSRTDWLALFIGQAPPCVCVFVCVLARAHLDGLNAGAQIPSMGHHTWNHFTSLSLN